MGKRSREKYEASITSRCWWGDYIRGWGACKEIQHDKKLRAIVDLEAKLSPIPDWARDIAQRSIRFAPGCPHYTFPAPLLELVNAIGRRKPQEFIHGCYTVDRTRKKRASDYLFCLDAWLQDAAPEQASRELKLRSEAPVDWDQVCQSIWQVLGRKNALKRMLVARTLHRYRWWVKACTWDDGSSDDFCDDQYLGDLPRGESLGYHLGNPGMGDPWHAELQAAYVRDTEAKLAKKCPDWKWFKTAIHETWLCAPKTFRFLERLLWSIGKGKPSVSLPGRRIKSEDTVPGFLQCEDTYPDREESVKWLQAFHRGLKGWCQGNSPSNDVEHDIHNRLGESEPLTRWLVGLLIRNLELLKPLGVRGGIKMFGAVLE